MCPYRYSVMNTESSGHAMLTIRITFPEDLGEYTCTARNDAGEAVTIGHLISEGKDCRTLLYNTVWLDRTL